MLAEANYLDIVIAVLAAAGLVLAGAIPVLISQAKRSNIRDQLGNVDSRVGLIATMMEKLTRDFGRHLDWHDNHTQGRVRSRREDDE